MDQTAQGVREVLGSGAQLPALVAEGLVEAFGRAEGVRDLAE